MRIHSVILVLLLATACQENKVSLNLTSEVPGNDSTDAETPSSNTFTGPINPYGTVASCPGGPTVFSTNMNARYVIGQANFTTSLANRGGSLDDDTLSNPIGVFMKYGKLYIGDASNKRALVFNTRPQVNGAGADHVIGQIDFTSSVASTTVNTFDGIQGLSTDDRYVYLSQWTGNRVSVVPLDTLTDSIAQLGQPDHNSGAVNNGGLSSSSMNRSVSNIVVGDKIIVADSSNHRVLIYNKNNLSTGMAAEVVIGQNDFTSNSSGTGANQLNFPIGLASDGTRLAITSSSANKVYIYNTIPTVNGASADVVLGSFGTAANQFNQPVGVFFHDNKLFVADRSNDRVLIWNTIPTVGNENADIIIGQPAAGTGDHNQCNCSTPAANTLWGPHMIFHDGCRLIVTDTQNNRVLIY